MQNVPKGTPLVSAADPRSVVSESSHGRVPNRRECLNENGLGQRYPNVVNNQIPAMEVFQAKVARLID